MCYNVGMNRNGFEKFIVENYNVGPEYLWVKYPTIAVFRHKENKKWFAVVMTINKKKLGIEQNSEIDVVNLKCESVGMFSLVQQNGIFPAYHMNKNHWISVCLDNSVDEQMIKVLLDISYNLTNTK